MIRLLQTLGDRFTLYLPVILMGLLALGTYWLVRSTPRWIPPEQVFPPRHEVDYLMRKFSVKTFDAEGQLKSEVLGSDARHYADTDTLEIDFVRIRAFDKEGRLSTASANRALTNASVSEIQLSGNARVLREPMLDKRGLLQPRLEFRGEFLHAFMDTERVTSDHPVLLLRGNNSFTADTMDFDSPNRVIELKGRVKGILVPEASK